jgi:hypothetical protein
VKADDFWKALQEGASWVDAENAVDAPKLLESRSAPVVAPTWEMRLARRPMSPLLSKIYEESNLRVRV